MKIYDYGIYGKTAVLCGIMAAVVGVVAALGLVIGLTNISSYGVRYIPMAPNTGLLFVLTGSSLVTLLYRPGKRLARFIVGCVIIFSTILAGITLMVHLGGLWWDVDALFININGMLDSIPLGHMSPITAVLFLLVNAALAASIYNIKKITPVLGSVIVFGGGVILLGYLYGAPLLYGGTFIPVAFSTALAFLFLGSGFIFAAGPETWPLRKIAGSSTKARLLRALLPVILAVVVIGDWVSAHFFMSPDPRVVVVSAVTLIAIMAILYVSVSQISKIIGNAIDRANSEKEMLQAQLLKAEKMSSVGNLAGGIAHQLNNPMTTILGTTQLLMRGAAKDSQLYSDLESIESMAQRCKNIITMLLTHSYAKDSEPEEIHLVDTIENAITLMADQMTASGIELQRLYDEGEHKLTGIGFQLEQLFLNIIINACESMPRGGKLSIAVAAKGDAEVITFADTGIGIPEDSVCKIFDPFYTTKEEGKHLGLGLYIGAQIVQKHKGSISVKGLEGAGSAFTITLPHA